LEIDGQVRPEHFVSMDRFASQLRRRSEELNISQAEAARRSGMSEGRYGHYANGIREPDLATLVRIAKALQTTPNWLLGFTSEKSDQSRRALLKDRLHSATNALRDNDLESLIVQIEALANFRRRSGITT
jgi:transcriptional regulator with XRE-family HTH domain